MSISISAKAQNETLDQKLSATQFSIFCALFFVIFYNSSFFETVFALVDYSTLRGFIFIANISLVLWLFTSIIISLITLPYIVKTIFPIVFITASIVAYFMDAYGVVIHRLMIQNVAETDFSETRDLFNMSLVLYVVALGLLPALLILKIKISYEEFKTECWRKTKFIAIAFIGCLALIMSMSMDYASFFRNHKNIRQMANPLNFIYAGLSYAATSNKIIEVKPIENDAAINSFGKYLAKPTLFILVVGETARADHFGINGYKRDTTPLIAQQNIINFPKVTSCGTETAVSVPCMFSALGRSGYSDSKAKSQEGLLDVINHAGISVLWRDNNSSCKGTCNRIAFEDMQRLQIPNICNDRECFDEILLHFLDEKITAENGSKVIVLHQKGSHGPDYFYRYPDDKEVFTPVCKTNQLQNCTTEEVINAYDNTIRYTDYFLNSTIEWLKTKSSQYNTSLLYLSDHGESLGENGLYLHGMPYALAPKEQKQVPLFLWLSDDYAKANAINTECLKQNNTLAYSHDNLFHTVLGMLNIQTQIYNPDLDIVKPCRTSMGN
ncbi:phosphoethanolamine--lipid A transferase [Cellvibrio sp. UBA7671]|uniref:phosphoethanolamine transferase n=1 Tax=Cellvibrio sp. UBA7671 TaxID=1946312 RepID=UPI002F34F570